MIEGLISLLIVCLVVGIVAGVIIYCIDLLPAIPPNFKQIAKILVILIALLVILMNALPLLSTGVVVAD